MSDKNPLSEFANLVPYPEFDIIARVVPGAIALFVVLTIHAASLNLPGFIQLLLAIMGAYLFGFFLEKGSKLLQTERPWTRFQWFWNIFHTIFKKIFAILGISVPKVFQEIRDNDKEKIWDLANRHSDGNSKKIGKMFAELQLFESLSTFCFLYGLFLLVYFKIFGIVPYLGLPAWKGYSIFLLISVILNLFYYHHRIQIRQKLRKLWANGV
jgi:hypothetical protein